MKISKLKQEKISEQILHYLYSVSPTASFTSHIAYEIARDEEFTKCLLANLKKKGFIAEVKKNSAGVRYIKRSRWKLSEQVFRTYALRQNNTPPEN